MFPLLLGGVLATAFTVDVLRRVDEVTDADAAFRRFMARIADELRANPNESMLDVAAEASVVVYSALVRGALPPDVQDLVLRGVRQFMTTNDPSGPPDFSAPGSFQDDAVSLLEVIAAVEPYVTDGDKERGRRFVEDAKRMGAAATFG
jgi:hypothetical protein